MEYDFRKIEQQWQKAWKESDAYKVSNESAKPKYYVLDMFPYPSGAGLHVGHPLGYIASDIYSRYKRLKGFNVLHPMGFDSFGLPAEQYALETGQHPATTTEKNIATFKAQLDKIGFCYDWDREVRTSDPQYYKWTQWIFLQLFNSYFCNTQKKARPIVDLVKKYETKGNKNFTAEQWNAFTKKEQEDILMNRRLAFSKYGEVNWCEALGTVLANDEVVNGVSERGGHPVEKKKMRQWYLRITDYADRLLEGLETVDFSDSMKEMQRNWIGKSEGAEMEFEIVNRESSGVSVDSTDRSSPLTTHHSRLRVYTTRPDTIFGVDFLVLAPEHELVKEIASAEQKNAVDEYLHYVKSRSERERLSEAKTITGCFTGAYAINPFDGREIPIWIAEYVLAGYGTGAIMAVPCGDQRDFAFAKHFNIPITNIIGSHFNGEEANATKDAILENSGFLNGLLMKDAIGVAVNKIEELGIGKRKVNYRMRDAGFSRQRYWGEPFPIIWTDGIAIPLDAEELPLELPHVDTYGPGPEGEGPLANIKEWVNTPTGRRETSTMPGYAGSSWYFLRYMDPNNNETFCDRKASDYWNQVDLYIGGTEHAVGHLLYSRMWTKVLFDLELIGYDEPFKKLLNQGMIQGSSRFVYRIAGTNQFVSHGKKTEYDVQPLHVDVNIVDGVELDIEAFKKWKPEFADAEFIFEDGTFSLSCSVGTAKEMKFICGVETEKMSKSKYNTVNPDELCDKYGADTFRMYEMFLGPVEASKPWDTKGIEGVHRFLRKLWRLFNDDLKGKVWNDEKATDAELKVLHRTIKKIEEDTERFSFNTAVSTFMICVNELADIKCNKKEVLEKLLILLTPYAPHIAAELWNQLGNAGSVLDATYPTFNAALLVESTKEYPVSINGKLRTNMELALDLDQTAVEVLVLQNEIVQKWLEGKAPKKIIFVKNKMINVVI
ncbi:MAG: leucine--tRNA ligase [Chitinophagaceae bacterium]|nr:leucine--tRNA ligase [Chitinophagaceae bacterium]